MELEGMGSKGIGQEEQQPTLAEWSEMALPGFRFHPTEEELVGYYLRRMVQGRRNSVELIALLDLYQYDPWELPAMAFMGEKEWFFFCPRDKKYPNGARPNRVTASGYWKATGTDRPVRCSGDSRCIGLKKTLVFYTGRAPRGNKTEWIMNEYRMPKPAERSISVMTSGVNSISYSFSTYDNFVIKNDVALCRIYRKSSSALNSVNFISAIGARELEERTSRIMSRFENQQATAEQLQPHNQSQRLQAPVNSLNIQNSTDNDISMVSSMSAGLSDKCDNTGNLHQQPSKTNAVNLISHNQLVEADTQHQLVDGGPQRSYDHGIPSGDECSGTSTEASSRQMNIALRMAMAKLDGMGSSSTAKYNQEDHLESDSQDIFGCFTHRLIQDSSSPTTKVMDSTRDPSATLMGTPSPDAAPAAVIPIKNNDPSCYRRSRILIPSSYNTHVNSSPSTCTTATTVQCLEAAAAAATTTPSAIALNTIHNCNISASSITQMEDEVQRLVNACSMPPLSNTYSLKRPRVTRLQQFPVVGDLENHPMAKMPSVAQYWRQSSAPSASPPVPYPINAFDALSGLTFQY